MASAGIGSVRKSLGQFSQDANAAKMKAEAFQEKMQGIGALGRTVAVGAGIVAGSIGLLGKAAISAAGEFEQNRIAFETMLGSTEKAKVLLGELKALALKTPFEYKDIVEYSKRLLAMGISANEVTKQMTNLGNISAGVGMEKMPQLVLAFGQVRAAGHLTGMELRQFTEAGVPLLETLASQYNVTTGQMQKMISNGTIGFDAVSKAMASMSGEGGKFNDLMAKQSKSLGGTISNLKDAVYQLAGGFGNALLPVVRPIVDLLGRFVGYLAGLSPTTKTVIATIGGLVFVFTALATGVGIIASIAPTIVSGFVLLKTAAIALSGAFMATPIIGWASAIVSVGIVVYKFRREIQYLAESIVLHFINPIKSAILAIQSWIDAYNKFAKAVPGIPVVNIDITPAIKKLDELEKKHKNTKKELGAAPNAKLPSIPELQKVKQVGNTLESDTKKSKLLEDENKNKTDALLTALNQEVEMRKIFGDITLQQERDKYAELLKNTELGEQQRLQIRQKMFELDKELAKQKLVNDQYLWSEEQKMLFDRDQFLKLNADSGMTQSKMNAKAFLDIARNQAKEEISLDKAVMASSQAYANQQLDLQKAQVIAWVDIEAAKWAADGAARLAASFGVDPTGWALLAAAGAATVGIRQVASQVKLAKGGIVMPTAGGTVATIGEAGSAEAVIPLDSPKAEAMLGGSGGDNSGPVVINVMVDNAQLAKVVYKNIRELQRSGQIAGGL